MEQENWGKSQRQFWSGKSIQNEEPTPIWLWCAICFFSGVAITLVHVVIYGS